MHILSLFKDIMVIHGIYLKSRPKGLWHLVSVAISAEAANYEISETLKTAALQGNDRAEAAVQIYESAFHIPELLHDLKNQKPMFN